MATTECIYSGGGGITELDISYSVAVSSFVYRTGGPNVPVAALGFTKAKLIATNFEYANSITYLDENGTTISSDNFSGVGDEKTFPAGTATVTLSGGANSSNQNNPVSATVRLSK